MYAEGAISAIKAIQSAFKVLGVLQLTAFLWPHQAVVNDGASFDFIIVGAGTAGSVIASRLTEDPKINVLLIEAGGDPPIESDFPSTMLFLKRSLNDWNYTSENDSYIAQCHHNPFFEMTLGKMLGGSSSLSYLNYGRGLIRDYNSWAEITKDDTWSWPNVLEYFKKIEKVDNPEIMQSPDGGYHGADGYLIIKKDPRKAVQKYLDAFKELGNDIHADLNHMHNLGYSELMLTIGGGSRQSAAYAYLRPAKDRSNLHVLKHTTVNKILIDDNKRAYGVEAASVDGKIMTLKATKEVIVSAGVFNSPKLLMLSGVGPKNHLHSMNIDVISDLPVGQNLQDQVSISLLHKMEKYNGPLPSLNPHENPAPQIIGYVALNKSNTEPDYASLSFLVDPDMILYFCVFAYRYSHEICEELYKSGEGRKMIFHQILLLTPKSRGQVLLRSLNPSHPPLIYVNYLADDEDLDNVVKYIEHFSAIEKTLYFRSVEAERVDPTGSKCGRLSRDSKDYWRCYAQCMLSGISYYTGTCSMGSVVDSKLRVFGIQGLRVADASIMPTVPEGAPISSIMMIGEKLAQFLKDDAKNY